MRVVWALVGVACVALAAFLLFLTLTRDDVPLRGFVLTAVPLSLGVYAALQARPRRDAPPPAG